MKTKAVFHNRMFLDIAVVEEVCNEEMRCLICEYLYRLVVIDSDNFQKLMMDTCSGINIWFGYTYRRTLGRNNTYGSMNGD